jgi:hypothetical protein
MKFTYFTIGLLAALTTATPISDPEKYPEDYASGHVTGELAPQSVSAPIKERALFKRSNVDFTFFSSGGRFLFKAIYQRFGIHTLTIFLL